MIPGPTPIAYQTHRKPRASGDDPEEQMDEVMVVE